MQGVPKKKWFVENCHWGPLGWARVVGPFLKNSGNSLSDRHKNCSIWPIRSWENWVQRWQPYLRKLKKMEKIPQKKGVNWRIQEINL